MRDEVIRKIIIGMVKGGDEIAKAENANVAELLSAYASAFLCSMESGYRNGVAFATLETAVLTILGRLNKLENADAPTDSKFIQ